MKIWYILNEIGSTVASSLPLKAAASIFFQLVLWFLCSRHFIRLLGGCYKLHSQPKQTIFLQALNLKVIMAIFVKDVMSLSASLVDTRVRIRVPGVMVNKCDITTAGVQSMQARQQVQAAWQWLWQISDLLSKRRVHLCVWVYVEAAHMWVAIRAATWEAWIRLTDQWRKRRNKKRLKLCLRWRSDEPSVFKIKLDGWWGERRV